MPALEVVEVRRSFGAIQALAGCSFRVEHGSVTGLVGPNGSGKTTLFNCVTGVLPPEAGDIKLDGASILRWPSHRIARAGVGRTFQTTRVFKKLTVRQNLEVAAVLAGRRSAEAGMRFLDLFGLRSFQESRAGQLSYGQQKLVELAAVMTGEPSLILLDEPASGVSVAFLQKLREYILQLRSNDRTFLMVEHNMPFVFNVCDTVIVMDAGATIAEGPVEAIQRDERVLNAYLGAPDAS